jgi:hypothetical protein
MIPSKIQELSILFLMSFAFLIDYPLCAMNEGCAAEGELSQGAATESVAGPASGLVSTSGLSVLTDNAHDGPEPFPMLTAFAVAVVAHDLWENPPADLPVRLHELQLPSECHPYIRRAFIEQDTTRLKRSAVAVTAMGAYKKATNQALTRMMRNCRPGRKNTPAAPFFAYGKKNSKRLF